MTVGAAGSVAWLSFGDKESSPVPPLTLTRQENGPIFQHASVSTGNVLPDFFEKKYPRNQRAEFQISSSTRTAIFVLGTGVQVRTDSGWQPFSEEPRNEIWRLKPGIARDMFVHIPLRESKELWRAYIRYGTEMRGPSLLRAQVREAWMIRSFTNWTGRAWGGGRFAGQCELFSEAFSK